MRYRGNKFRRFRRSPPENKSNNLPWLEKIDDLSVEDLKKIKQTLQRSQTRWAEYKEKFAENTRKTDYINAANRRNIDKFENWKNEYNNKIVAPLESDWDKVVSKIDDNTTGLISGVFTETKTLQYFRYPLTQRKLTINPYSQSQRSARLPTHLAEQFSSELALLERNLKKCVEKIKETNDRMLAANSEHIPVPNQPNSSSTLTITGMKIRFNHDDFSLLDVEKLIRKKLTEEQAKDAKREEEMDAIKARAAVNEREVRSQTEKYKKDFAKQKQLLDICPYCGTLLTASRSHLDHIIPVSKGGRAYPANLVFVCSDCNQKKSNTTLAKFILEQNLNLTVIYSRLKKLKKDF